MSNALESEWTYYAGIGPLRPKPTTVFRFSKDVNKLPERYSMKDGWVEDRDLMLMKMKGDIVEAAKIDSNEANEIINRINL